MKRKSTPLNWFGRALALLMLLVSAGVAAAESQCNEIQLHQAFLPYLKSVSQDDVKRLQTSLNTLKLGSLDAQGEIAPLDVEGVLGSRTRYAMMLFCRALGLEEKKHFAPYIVGRVDVYAQVTDKYPQPQAIVASDDFQRWLAIKGDDYLAVLHHGDVAEVTLVFDEYFRRPKPVVQVKPVMEKKEKKAPVPVSLDVGAQTYYKWSEAAVLCSTLTSAGKDGADQSQETEAVINAEATAVVTETVASGDEASSTTSKTVTTKTQTTSKTKTKPSADAPVEPPTLVECIEDALPDSVGGDSKQVLAVELEATLNDLADIPFVSREMFKGSLYGWITKRCENAVQTADDQLSRWKAQRDCRNKVDAYYADAAFGDLMAKVVQAAQTQGSGVFDVSFNNVQSTEGCGCSVQRDSVVYGVLPYSALNAPWLGEAEKKEEKPAEGEATDNAEKDAPLPYQVDFSRYDRVGVYAVALDKEGELSGHERFNDATFGLAGFMNLARKHRVRTDVFISVEGWRDWDDKAAGQAAMAVAELIGTPLTDASVPWWSKHLMGVKSPEQTYFSGVTLYLTDYPAVISDDDDFMVSTFIRQLRTRLDEGAGGGAAAAVEGAAKESVPALGMLEQKQDSPFLNIAMDVNPLGYKFASPTLTALMTSSSTASEAEAMATDACSDSDARASAIVDCVLVFLPQATTNTKKWLRQVIENESSGVERRQVLRKIVPMLLPVDIEEARKKYEPFGQFKDDLIYTEDNFAGVGLWPIPTTSYKDMVKVDEYLAKYFDSAEKQQGNTFEKLLNSYSPGACDFICENRLEARAAWQVLLVVLVGYGIFFLMGCKSEECAKVRRRILLGLGLSSAAGLAALTGCDPYYSENSETIAMGVGAVFVLVIAGLIYFANTKEPLP